MEHSVNHLVLDLVGGVLYLANKVFFDIMERRDGRDAVAFLFWKRMAWIVYLLGLPAVLIVFYQEKNWIFGAVELGGMPAMLCGLIASFSLKDPPKILDKFALYAIPVGLFVTLFDFKSWSTFLLQLFGSAGFLIGTRALSKRDEKKQEQGYYWFFVMNIATALLFFVQERYLWIPQQIISVLFVLDALRVRRLRKSRAQVLPT